MCPYSASLNITAPSAPRPAPSPMTLAAPKPAGAGRLRLGGCRAGREPELGGWRLRDLNSVRCWGLVSLGSSCHQASVRGSGLLWVQEARHRTALPFPGQELGARGRQQKRLRPVAAAAWLPPPWRQQTELINRGSESHRRVPWSLNSRAPWTRRLNSPRLNFLPAKQRQQSTACLQGLMQG